MIVLKIGGSVVTRKDEPETVDEDALDAVAAALGEYDGDLVVVHGAGSFGHHHADRHGLSETKGTHDPDAVLDVHRSMVDLNDRVVDALRAADVPALPVHPLSFAHRAPIVPRMAGDDGPPTELTLPTGGLVQMLDEGFVPVLHGDGIVHAGHGVTILSGDEVVAILGETLDADRVGLCAGVPGVLRDGDVIDRIERYDDVADVLGGSDATDVTGGMAGKVRRLLDLPVPASVFGREDLAAFLAGEDVGTLIHGSER